MHRTYFPSSRTMKQLFFGKIFPASSHSEASGTVTAWTGGTSPMSVWSRIEKPALMLNPNVNKIIIQDATQPWKTKIIYK